VSLVNGPVDEERASVAPPARDSTRLRVLLVGMASLVLALGAVFGRHGLLEARQFRLERDRLREENARMERDNEALAREVESLERDPLAIERIAREELGLARPGEKLILLAAERRQDVPLVSTSPGLDAIPSRP
jgi:cell division protein FtsB